MCVIGITWSKGTRAGRQLEVGVTLLSNSRRTGFLLRYQGGYMNVASEGKKKRRRRKLTRIRSWKMLNAKR